MLTAGQSPIIEYYGTDSMPSDVDMFTLESRDGFGNLGTVLNHVVKRRPGWALRHSVSGLDCLAAKRFLQGLSMHGVGLSNQFPSCCSDVLWAVLQQRRASCPSCELRRFPIRDFGISRACRIVLTVHYTASAFCQGDTDAMFLMPHRSLAKT